MALTMRILLVFVCVQLAFLSGKSFFLVIDFLQVVVFKTILFEEYKKNKTKAILNTSTRLFTLLLI